MNFFPELEDVQMSEMTDNPLVSWQNVSKRFNREFKGCNLIKILWEFYIFVAGILGSILLFLLYVDWAKTDLDGVAQVVVI